MPIHSDMSLAGMLREEIERHIEIGIAGLIKRPEERLAGRVEALQQVLDLIDGKIQQLNDRPTKQEA